MIERFMRWLIGTEQDAWSPEDIARNEQAWADMIDAHDEPVSCPAG